MSREVGLIKFNQRVLSQAANSQVPLLERLAYLCIVSKNCEELFEVRIAKLKKKNNQTQLLQLIRQLIEKLYINIYTVYKQIVLELRAENIVILGLNEWNNSVYAWVDNYFNSYLKKYLVPILINKQNKFPHVVNKNLYLAVEFYADNRYQLAIIEAPRNIARVTKISTNEFILLQDIIVAKVNVFLPQVTIVGCYPFRVTRGADVILDKNVKTLKTQLFNRRRSACTRLELDVSNGIMHKNVSNILLKQFNLVEDDLFLINGPVNLFRLKDILLLVDKPHLRFKNFRPQTFSYPNIFSVIDKKDMLIHTPYQSFDTIVELVKQANDRKTVKIQITLYRIGVDSILIQNLIKASQDGIKVTASVELFARFDEEINLELAKELKNAGVEIIYGVVDYKVHAKMLLITRKNNNEIKHYAHISTGNYHQDTAKLYTDFGLITANLLITQDIESIFAQITGEGFARALQLIYQAPYNLYSFIMKSIDFEINQALSRQKSLIILKVNSLTDVNIINKLYLAAQAGVEIILLVRSACLIRPNKNIQILSVVDRFLEHHRIYYFFHKEHERIFISSADFIKRNFFRRIEVCVPILDPDLKQRVYNEGLKLYIDNSPWQMDYTGDYIFQNKLSIHEALIKKFSV